MSLYSQLTYGGKMYFDDGDTDYFMWNQDAEGNQTLINYNENNQATGEVLTIASFLESSPDQISINWPMDTEGTVETVINSFDGSGIGVEGIDRVI